MITEQDYLFSALGGIGAPEAWALAREKGDLADVVVAVLGSGIRKTHEDLRNQLWINAGEIPDNGRDDDKNGYVDDVNGWDFYHDSNDVEDTLGRGTFMAGIIAGEHNNGAGIAGIAPNARIMSVAIMSGTKSGGYSWTSRTGEAIHYAIDNGADIIVLNGIPDSDSISTMTELLPEISASGVHVVVPSIHSSLLSSFPELINYITVGEDQVDLEELYLDDIGDDAGQIECALRDTKCYSADIEGDDSYAMFTTVSDRGADCAIIAGVLALLKGIYPEDDAAMITTRLIAGSRKESVLERLTASGGYLDAGLAISSMPEKRLQYISSTRLRDYNVEEGDIDLSFHAGSGLPVDIELLEGPVELDDGVLHPTGDTGLVRVMVSQPGNAEYFPAPGREFSFRLNDSIKILQAASDLELSVNSLFWHPDVDGNVMVRVRDRAGEENDTRSGEVYAFTDGNWKLKGPLHFPDRDEQYFPAAISGTAAINGNWIALSISSWWMENSGHSDEQAIFIYHIDDLEKGEFSLIQEIYPPEPSGNITNWGLNLRLGGRWLYVGYNKIGDPGYHRLYRRDDDGVFQYFPTEGEHRSYAYALSENLMVRTISSWQPASIDVFETGDNSEPVLIQSFPKPFPSLGYVLSTNEDWIVLGNSLNSDRYSKAGALLLYRRDVDGLFAYHQTLYPDDARKNQYFGGGYPRGDVVSIDGDKLVVSAPRAGSVIKEMEEQYVYSYDAATALWCQVYRTRSPRRIMPSEQHVPSVSLADGWLNVYDGNDFISFDLNNPKRLSQSLDFVQDESEYYVDSDPIEPEVFAIGEGDLEISVVSGPATVEGNMIVLTGEPGTVEIEAKLRESWIYDASPAVQRSINVLQYEQSIQSGTPPGVIYEDSSISIDATATSGLPIQFEILSGPGSVVPGGIIVEEYGDFEVRLSQEGDWRFLPAEPVTLEFTALPGWRREFDAWTLAQGWTGEDAEPGADPESDGYSLLETFFLGGQPELGISVATPDVKIGRRYYTTELRFRYIENGPKIILQRAVGSADGPWETVREIKDPEYLEEEGLHGYKILLQRMDEPVFLRLVVTPE